MVRCEAGLEVKAARGFAERTRLKQKCTSARTCTERDGAATGMHCDAAGRSYQRSRQRIVSSCARLHATSIDRVTRFCYHRLATAVSIEFPQHDRDSNNVPCCCTWDMVQVIQTITACTTEQRIRWQACIHVRYSADSYQRSRQSNSWSHSCTHAISNDKVT